MASRRSQVARLHTNSPVSSMKACASLPTLAEKVQFERNRLARAPLVVAVVSRAKPHVKIPDWEQVLSAGAVCMNLLHAAAALGYGASWITEWYAFDRRVLDALGLDPDERIAGFVHIGRALEPPVERARPALADVVTRF